MQDTQYTGQASTISRANGEQATAHASAHKSSCAKNVSTCVWGSFSSTDALQDEYRPGQTHN